MLTIDRPERRNALNADVIGALQEALHRARSDDTIRAVVLTGAGDEAFCAGADLGADAFEFDYATPTNAYADLLRTARTLDVPLVARVNGACMAGGMGLLAMCDLAIAAPHAIFGLPEAKVGVFPMQVLAVLQAQVPQRFLAQLCLTGDPIDAARAREIGLVNEVADDLDGALERLLSRLQSQLAHRAAARPVRDEGDALDVVRGGDRVRRRADRPAGDDAGRARGHRRIQGKEETAMDRQVKPRVGQEMKMHRNKVAFITGANKGLGFEIARQLGQQGVTVVLGARDDAKAKAAADKLKAEGVDAHGVKLDVTNESDVEALPAFFESKFGRLDILVNNAGVALDHGGVTRETFRQTYETNLIAPYFITQALLPLLKASPAGRIVNQSSAMGSLTAMSDPNSFPPEMAVPAYCSSKAALNMLTVTRREHLKARTSKQIQPILAG